MKKALVVDTSCCLPESFAEKHNIHMVPHLVRMAHKKYILDLDYEPERRIKIYQHRIFADAVDSQIVQPTEKIVRKYVLDKLSRDNDLIYCLTNCKTLTPIYYSFQKNAEKINAYASKIRSEVGITTPLLMRLQESGSVAAGHAALMATSVELFQQDRPLVEITNQVEALKPYVKSLILVPDLLYLQRKANQMDHGADTSSTLLSTVGAALGKFAGITPVLISSNNVTKPIITKMGFDKNAKTIFDYAISCVEKGLMSNYVSVGYAGDLKELEDLGLAKLRKACEGNGVELLASVAPLPNGHGFGEKSLSIGFISDDETYSV